MARDSLSDPAERVRPVLQYKATRAGHGHRSLQRESSLLERGLKSRIEEPSRNQEEIGDSLAHDVLGQPGKEPASHPGESSLQQVAPDLDEDSPEHGEQQIPGIA